MAEIKITLVNGELAGKTAQEIGKNVRQATVELSKAKIGTEEWVKANEKLGNAKKLQEDLGKQIKATSGASDSLKKSFGGLLNQIPGFSQLTSAFNGVKGGVGGVTSGFGKLKVAIASSGVGLLVLALGAVVNWMMKVEAITNVVKGVFDGMTAAVSVLINAFATLSFDNLTGKMAVAAGEAYSLVQAFDALEDKQREIDLSNEEAGKTLDQLMLRSKNVQLSYAERIALLDQADEIETAQHQRRLAYAEEYAAVVAREVANAEAQGLMNDELADKQLEAKKALIAVEREDIALQEKIANRRSALEEKQQAEQEKRAEAARKAREKRIADERKALEENQKVEDNLRKLADQKRLLEIEDARQKEIAANEIATNEKIIALQGSEAQILEQMKLLREIQYIELIAIDEKYAAQAEEKRLARLAKEQADSQAEYEFQKAANTKRLEEEKTLAQQKADFEAQMAQIEIDSAQAVVSFGFEAIAAKEKNEKAAKRIRKIGAIAEIGFNLGKELSANAAAAAANPLNAVTFGAAGAAQLAASNIKSLLFAGINLARVAIFKDGGILQGPSHAQGGINLAVGGRVVANAEGGEPILTAAVSRNPMLLAAASRINVAAGGRPLMADGGITPSAASAGGFDADALARMIAANNMQMLNAFETRITNIRVQNNVLDADKKLSEVRQIENEVNV